MFESKNLSGLIRELDLEEVPQRSDHRVLLSDRHLRVDRDAEAIARQLVGDFDAPERVLGQVFEARLLIERDRVVDLAADPGSAERRPKRVPPPAIHAQRELVPSVVAAIAFLWQGQPVDSGELLAVARRIRPARIGVAVELLELDPQHPSLDRIEAEISAVINRYGREAVATAVVEQVGTLGTFQAFIPGVTKQPSPVFQDSEQGLKAFTDWATKTIGEPAFNQPPHHICVVGALPFVDKGPAISEPIWKSRMPVRTLEPYHATFHYAEAARGATPPKPRTMKQAVDICSKARPR